MPITDIEKNRRRRLLKVHYDTENAHDMQGVMDTFSPNGEMVYNATRFSDQESIIAAHHMMGFQGPGGAMENLQLVIDTEHFTEDEIVVEGTLQGTHVGDFMGIGPSGVEVELPYVAFYRFDEADKLVSERVVMNLGPLATATD